MASRSKMSSPQVCLLIWSLCLAMLVVSLATTNSDCGGEECYCIVDDFDDTELIGSLATYYRENPEDFREDSLYFESATGAVSEYISLLSGSDAVSGSSTMNVTELPECFFLDYTDVQKVTPVFVFRNVESIEKFALAMNITYVSSVLNFVQTYKNMTNIADYCLKTKQRQISQMADGNTDMWSQVSNFGCYLLLGVNDLFSGKLLTNTSSIEEEIWKYHNETEEIHTNMAKNYMDSSGTYDVQSIMKDYNTEFLVKIFRFFSASVEDVKNITDNAFKFSKDDDLKSPGDNSVVAKYSQYLAHNDRPRHKAKNNYQNVWWDDRDAYLVDIQDHITLHEYQGPNETNHHHPKCPMDRYDYLFARDVGVVDVMCSQLYPTSPQDRILCRMYHLTQTSMYDGLYQITSSFQTTRIYKAFGNIHDYLRTSNLQYLVQDNVFTRTYHEKKNEFRKLKHGLTSVLNLITISPSRIEKLRKERQKLHTRKPLPNEQEKSTSYAFWKQYLKYQISTGEILSRVGFATNYYYNGMGIENDGRNSNETSRDHVTSQDIRDYYNSPSYVDSRQYLEEVSYILGREEQRSKVMRAVRSYLFFFEREEREPYEGQAPWQNNMMDKWSLTDWYTYISRWIDSVSYKKGMEQEMTENCNPPLPLLPSADYRCKPTLFYPSPKVVFPWESSHEEKGVVDCSSYSVFLPHLQFAWYFATGRVFIKIISSYPSTRSFLSLFMYDSRGGYPISYIMCLPNVISTLVYLTVLILLGLWWVSVHMAVRKKVIEQRRVALHARKIQEVESEQLRAEYERSDMREFMQNMTGLLRELVQKQSDQDKKIALITSHVSSVLPENYEMERVDDNQQDQIAMILRNELSRRTARQNPVHEHLGY